MTGGPRRTCIGCRQVKDKVALMRLVKGEDGRVKVDHAGTEMGRGAYVCPARECLDKALVVGRLTHALRETVRPPRESSIDILQSWRRR